MPVELVAKPVNKLTEYVPRVVPTDQRAAKPEAVVTGVVQAKLLVVLYATVVVPAIPP